MYTAVSRIAAIFMAVVMVQLVGVQRRHRLQLLGRPGVFSQYFENKYDNVQGRINHSGGPYQRKAGALFSYAKPGFSYLWQCTFSPKKLTTFFSRRYV